MDCDYHKGRYKPRADLTPLFGRLAKSVCDLLVFSPKVIYLFVCEGLRLSAAKIIAFGFLAF